MAVSSCGDSGHDKIANAASASQDPYGIDGWETVAGIEFMPAQMTYDGYRNGSQYCWDFDEDKTCTQVARVSSVTADTISAYVTELQGTMKVVSPLVLRVRGKYLCQIFTEEGITASTAHHSVDRLSTIGISDIPMTENEHSAWHARLIRENKADMGKEFCYRYSVMTRTAEGKVDRTRVHTYLDGIEQHSGPDSSVQMYTRESTFLLRSRE